MCCWLIKPFKRSDIIKSHHAHPVVRSRFISFTGIFQCRFIKWKAVITASDPARDISLLPPTLWTPVVAASEQFTLPYSNASIIMANQYFHGIAGNGSCTMERSVMSKLVDKTVEQYQCICTRMLHPQWHIAHGAEIRISSFTATGILRLALMIQWY